MPPLQQRIRAFQHVFETKSFLIVESREMYTIGDVMPGFYSGSDHVFGPVRIVGFATPEEYREQHDLFNHFFHSNRKPKSRLDPYLYKVVAE